MTTKKNIDNTDLALLSNNIKEVVAKGIDNEKLKDKIQEYIEVSKLKMKLAKEILEIGRESTKTKGYLDDLENDLKQAERELNKTRDVNNLLTDLDK